jgi:hypothetical protein
MFVATSVEIGPYLFGLLRERTLAGRAVTS